MDHCQSCKGDLLPASLPYELSLTEDRVFVGEIEGHRCSSCGQVLFDGQDRGRFEVLVARWLVENGYEKGVELRFIRKVAGLRASDLAELLGVSPQAVSAWENDKHAMDASTRGTVGALVVDELDGKTTTRDRLRAMASTRPTVKKAERVRIGSAHAAE